MTDQLVTKTPSVIFCLIAALFATESVRAQEISPTALSASVVNQIRVLAAEKSSRTEAQQKIDSQYLVALKQRRSDALLSNLPMLRAEVEIDSDDTTLVDIRATVSPVLLSAIEQLGGTVINSFVEYDAIRARLPLESIETLAEDPDVRFIRPADKAMRNKVNTSEGDKAHNALAARGSFGVNGSGAKVCVLSDSVDHLAAVKATGDLPATVTVLQNAPGNSGEGTAMLEIVHDLAPGAQLLFATAWLGPASFANNIKACANAGAKVIVDDVMYFSESPFQDDIISQAVNTVTSNGAFHFSSAGNSGNKNDGQSGVWEGDYKGTTSLVSGYSSVHDFGGGDRLNRITMGSSAFTLFWTDPLGGSSNDYDFFIVDPGSTSIVLSATNVQNGDDDPYESIFLSGNPTNYQIVIAKYSGANRFINFSSNRGRLERNTAGQIRGHAAAENGFGVAAVSARGRTTPFTGSESVETFNSDGPRRVFFHPNGAPITPGNFSSTGGKVRKKPDIAAADGVMTATPGFNPFYGTSAAAPHAAALAALMVSKRPGITLAEMRDIFRNTALNIEAAGWDRDSGWGIIMANLVLSQILSGFNPAILYLLLFN